MKKKASIPFDPAMEVGDLYKEDRSFDLDSIRPGSYLKIGHPSNRYYEYVSPSLSPGNLSLLDLKKFRSIRGEILKIVSILKMSNGDDTVVLAYQDWRPFSEGTTKIYAHLEKGFESKELLPLDKQTLRLMEAGLLHGDKGLGD